ncbi:uncharacterized protein LOC143264092 [Megachile rotundata]|uniref:uncharacterized protein LOC143264092 n=1 Tax=Megachile rotundata TaxID=143995 RepID=UPI003FD61F3C
MGGLIEERKAISFQQILDKESKPKQPKKKPNTETRSDKSIDDMLQPVKQVLEEPGIVLLNTTEPTHFNMSNGSYSAIDLTFCSPNIYDNIEYTTSTELYSSDHFPIFVEFIDNNTAPNSTNCMEINQILEEFEELIIQAAAKSIPKTSNVIEKNSLPWWNNEYYNAIKEKKHVFNAYKKHKTDINLIEFKRAKLEKVLKQAKKDAWINYISSLTKNTPYSIHMVNLLATTFAKNSSNENFDLNFLKIKDSPVESARIEPIDSLAKNHPLNTEISYAELQSVLKSAKKSSPGPDNIPNVFIQQLSREGLNYLLDLYNCIWLNGVFHDKWQEAIVVPIIKPGKNKLQVDSYRLIAVTCCLCKLLEKILCKRLRWYLEVNNLLEGNQNGFRQHRSTIDSLTMLDTNICEAFLKKRRLVAICLDIEKAYDMVWRHRIIQQLQKWNIKGIMLHNFLKNRSMYVSVNGNLFKKTEIRNRVPQGSVLSVILFLIAINDITEVFFKPIKYTIFTDNCTFFITGTNLSTMQQILQDKLDKLQKFSL